MLVKRSVNLDWQSCDQLITKSDFWFYNRLNNTFYFLTPRHPESPSYTPPSCYSSCQYYWPPASTLPAHISLYLSITTFDDCHEGVLHVVAAEGWSLEVIQFILVCKLDGLLLPNLPVSVQIALVTWVEQVVPIRMQAMFYWEFYRNYLIHLGMF